MANITSFPLTLVIVGDGVSLTASVGVTPTPTSVSLVSAFASTGTDQSPNISSVTLTGSTVTFNFTSAFTGSISVEIALAYPAVNHPELQPVVQVTSPWIVSQSGVWTVQQGAPPWSVTFPTPQHVIADSITAPLPAGTNVLGHVINDASAAIIGKVGIDQTTPGTTNGVQVVAALPTGANTIGSVKITDGTTVVAVIAGTTALKTDLSSVSGTATVAAAAGIQKVGISDSTGLELDSVIKGIQAARALGVQNLKDSGRTALTFFIDNLVGSASEVLASMGITKGGAAQVAATSYTVTAGKTLRLTSINFTVRSSTNAQQISQVRVRTAASGIAITSPVILNFFGEAPAALTFNQNMTLSEGYEIAGGTQIAISHIEIVTPASTTLTVCLVGFEY